MHNIIAIIFGIVQGLTEFLPVSSSGHLIILHKFLPPLVLSDDLSFDVALHMGTLLALMVYFWKDCLRYLRAFFSKGFFKAKSQNKQSPLNADQQMARLILLAIIPAGFVGFFFESMIDEFFRSIYVVIVMLILVSILFFIVEKKSQSLNHISFESLTWKQ